jgi:predicted nucleotidyltransferase
LLAIKWIEQKNSVMPMEFGTLVEALIDDDRLKGEINGLLERKKQGLELDRGARIPLISEFIESELSRLETQLGKLKAPKPATKKLNQVFRRALETVW